MKIPVASAFDFRLLPGIGASWNFLGGRNFTVGVCGWGNNNWGNNPLGRGCIVGSNRISWVLRGSNFGLDLGKTDNPPGYGWVKANHQN